MSNLRERFEITEIFLEELQKGIPEEERLMVVYADNATVQTDSKGKKINSVFWPKPWKKGKPIMQQQNCYVCISSMKKTPNPKTGEERFWRTESAFGHGMAIMIDDIGYGKGSKGGLQLEHFTKILTPTAIIETSPENFQIWYFFDEPVKDLIQFKSFLTCFVGNVLKKGGDNTIKDVTRVGRMPCGINNKKEQDGSLKYNEEGKPFRVRMRYSNYDNRYSMEKISQRFGFTILLPQRRRFEINQEDWTYDLIWLKTAQRILTRMRMGEGSSGEVVENMSGKFRIKCPWGEEHSNGDPYGAYFRGAIAGAEHEFVFGCAHDCHRKGEGKKGWSAFVDAVVMPYIEENLDIINCKHGGIKYE